MNFIRFDALQPVLRNRLAISPRTIGKAMLRSEDEDERLTPERDDTQSVIAPERLPKIESSSGRPTFMRLLSPPGAFTALEVLANVSESSLLRVIKSRRLLA
jgi:hypothetical protein